MAISSDLDLSEGRSWLRRLLTLGVIVVIGAGIGFGLWWFYFKGSSGPATLPPQTATVTMGNIVGTLMESGSAVSTQQTKLSFANSGSGASGQVISISVQVGDNVKAGQELARLDPTIAQRNLSTAESNLQVAQLHLQQLETPATPDTIAAAQQSIIQAQNAVQTAQTNYNNAIAPPAPDVLAADQASVTQAQNSLLTAQNQVDSAWSALVSAQRNYCSVGSGQVAVCGTYDIPLTDAHVNDLNQELKNPTGTSTQVTAIVSANQALLSANTSYVNAKTSVANAQQSLTAAQAKLTVLQTPPTADTLAQLQGAITAAQAGLTAAQAKLQVLQAGPTSTDIALDQQSVDQAQTAVQVAQENLNSLVLTAPYAGQIGAIGFNVGDQVSSASTITLTNVSAVRVDLSVSETDLPQIKAGEFGLAQFTALPNENFLVKVTGVSTVPTITSGVVTYAVETQLLTGPDLQANAAALEALGPALGTLFGGGRTGGAAGGQGFAGQGANGQGFAGRTPNASRTPNPNRTPRAGGTTGANGGGFLNALANPTTLPAGGMTANVTLITNVVNNTLLLPTGAIKKLGRTSYVLVQKPDGTTQQVTVVTGASDTTNTAITSGLTEGEKVLLGAASTGATTSSSQTQQGGQFFGGGRGSQPVIVGGGGAPGGVR